MKEFFRKCAIAYFAGALGGLALMAMAWLMGYWHIYSWLHVAMSSPALTWVGLTHRLLEGSLWGLLIVALAPLLRVRGAMLGLVLGLFPAAYMLLIDYPRHQLGLMAANRGHWAFVVVLVLYGCWGLVTGLLYSSEYKS